MLLSPNGAGRRTNYLSLGGPPLSTFFFSRIAPAFAPALCTRGGIPLRTTSGRMVGQPCFFLPPVDVEQAPPLFQATCVHPPTPPPPWMEGILARRYLSYLEGGGESDLELRGGGAGGGRHHISRKGFEVSSWSTSNKARQKNRHKKKTNELERPRTCWTCPRPSSSASPDSPTA